MRATTGKRMFQRKRAREREREKVMEKRRRTAGGFAKDYPVFTSILEGKNNVTLICTQDVRPRRVSFFIFFFFCPTNNYHRLGYVGGGLQIVGEAESSPVAIVVENGSYKERKR